MSHDTKEFDFEYVGLKQFGPGEGVAIFGRLNRGSIRQNGPIALPTSDGSFVVGKVGHFQESFYDWLGLPFYHTVTADTAPFAIFIGIATSTSVVACPGRAWNPEST